MQVERLADGCWRWTGPGYHRREDDRPVFKRRYVYRLMYEALVGPIPSGTVMDHLCRRPWCVNPEHVEPVAQRTNIERGDWQPGDANVGQAAKTHCPAGHPYDEANTYRWRGERHCRACRRELKRARRRAAR